MHPRRRTYLIAAFGIASAIGLAIFAWMGSRVSTDLNALLLRLPTQDAVVAGVDFDALRASGALSSLLNPQSPQEPEYVAFVHDTGFDYQHDLHYVLVSFSPDGEFFFIRGRFDWTKLRHYVEQQKGACADQLCRLDGSTPEKKISFLRVRSDLMAMAVAPVSDAALRLEHPGPQADVTLMQEPLWLTFSAGALRHAASLPGAFAGSSRLFATAIMDAERVTVTAGPLSSGDLQARLEAVCRDAQQAGALLQQMQGLTRMLKDVAASHGQSTAQDSLGALLGSGSFSQAGAHVMGNWSIPRALISNLINAQ